MLALYRAGRQAEALEVFRDGRAALVEAFGLEPTPALKELETRDPPARPRARRAGTARGAPRRAQDRAHRAARRADAAAAGRARRASGGAWRRSAGTRC